jgi:hypothetical protein
MKIELRLTLACALLVLAACGDKDSAAPSPPAQAAPEAAVSTNATPPPAAAAEVATAALAPCRHCKWGEFLNKEEKLTVDRLECTNTSGNPEHCHLETPKPGLKRHILVMEDQASGGYSFELKTRGGGQEAHRMECVNLVPDLDNPRVIEGTCKVWNADHGPGVHHFRALLQPREDGAMWPDNTPWPEIVFNISHKPFALSPQGDPVHNGEGHVHLNN